MLQEVVLIIFSITSMLFLFTGTCTNCNCTFQALPSIAKEVIEVLDILLKWFVFVLQIKHNMSIEGFYYFCFLLWCQFPSFLLWFAMYGVCCNFFQFNCSGAGTYSWTAWHLEGGGLHSNRIWSGSVSSMPCRES